MNDTIEVTVTSPNESLERSVSLTDRVGLKKLKKRVVAIINDAIEAASPSAKAAEE